MYLQFKKNDGYLGKMDIMIILRMSKIITINARGTIIQTYFSFFENLKSTYFDNIVGKNGFEFNKIDVDTYFIDLDPKFINRLIDWSNGDIEILELIEGINFVKMCKKYDINNDYILDGLKIYDVEYIESLIFEEIKKIYEKNESKNKSKHIECITLVEFVCNNLYDNNIIIDNRIVFNEYTRKMCDCVRISLPKHVSELWKYHRINTNEFEDKINFFFEKEEERLSVYIDKYDLISKADDDRYYYVVDQKMMISMKTVYKFN